MYEKIDRATWERDGNFTFFEGFINPTLAVASRIECTGLRQKAKAQGRSFFLCYLYAALKAANAIKEMRCRIDTRGRILLFDRVGVVTPIKTPAGNFYMVHIPMADTFDDFLIRAQMAIGSIPRDGSPFEQQHNAGRDLNIVHLSATPDLYFTSITYARRNTLGVDYPLINIGKVVPGGGKEYFPISVCAHHGLVDGEHIAEFFRLTEQYLAEIFLSF